jgi:hypothetical protein
LRPYRWTEERRSREKAKKRSAAQQRAQREQREGEEAEQRAQREDEEAKQRESMWESDEDSDLESEQDSDEDKEEEGWIDTLVETIIEPKDYRKREENIINFLREYLFVRIYNMESSFEKRKVRKNEKKKYERLKEALEILDEHYETMKYIVNKAAEYEEMEITSGEDVEYDDDNVDDDDMEDDFMSIGEIRKSGGGKA